MEKNKGKLWLILVWHLPLAKIKLETNKQTGWQTDWRQTNWREREREKIPLNNVTFLLTSQIFGRQSIINGDNPLKIAHKNNNINGKEINSRGVFWCDGNGWTQADSMHDQ